MSKSVIELSSIQQEQFALVGGKAANLAKLAQWGLPTLAGFCVTTEAYWNALEFSNLGARIADILADTQIDDLEQVNASSKKIRMLIESIELSLSVTQEIHSAYTLLGEPAVAVRSSATAEDLPDASFAGQQDSYLNIIGFEQVIEHIKLCWGSLWTPRAIQYRAQQSIGNNNVYMAVVVQEMVQAEVAGVMFTINPLNNRLDQIVINASYGLGESVVSGAVTPDIFVLDKVSLRVLSTEIGTKETIILPKETGGVRNQSTNVRNQELPSLSRDNVSLLAELGNRVEKYFYTPQDIEWAYSQGKFFLLQARPITTQKPKKEKSFVKYSRLEKFLLEFLLDYFPSAPYHFDQSILISLVEVTLNLAEAFGLIAPKAQEVMKVEVDGVISLNPVLPKLTWRTPIGVIKGTIQAFRSLSVDPSVFHQNRWPKIEMQLKDIQKHDLQDMLDAQLINIIRKCISIRDVDVFVKRFDYFLGCWTAMIVLPLVLRVITGKKISENLYYALMSGLEHPTSIMNSQLRSLARNALSNVDIRDILEKGVSKTTWVEIEATSQGQVFLGEVKTFLGRFGVRTGMLVPFPSASIWKESPDKVLSLIAIMLRNPQSLQDRSAEMQKNQAFEAKSRALHLAARFPFGILKIPKLVNFLINYTQATLIERDWIIFAYESVNQPIRRAMLQIGKRLAERNIIAETDDIRFISLGEAEQFLTKASTIELISQLQKEINIRKLARTKTVSKWNKAILAPKPDGKADSILLRGTPASPGAVTGIARIILSESEFSRLNAGEILVCPATNPSWTPLFAIASGVVADTGGPLSHAAIVAREYGIPAVLGTQSATITMVDGQSYTINGKYGQVWASNSKRAIT